MLSLTPGPEGSRQALTKEEWLKRVRGEWQCDLQGHWLHNGRTSPDGMIGRLKVTETSSGYKKIEWIATHRISFYPKDGEFQTWLVMSRPNAYRPGHWIALTNEEWFSQCPPEWSCDLAGIWTWKGLITPKGIPGAVYIEDVSAAYPASDT